MCGRAAGGQAGIARRVDSYATAHRVETARQRLRPYSVGCRRRSRPHPQAHAGLRRHAPRRLAAAGGGRLGSGAARRRARALRGRRRSPCTAPAAPMPACTRWDRWPACECHVRARHRHARPRAQRPAAGRRARRVRRGRPDGFTPGSAPAPRPTGTDPTRAGGQPVRARVRVARARAARSWLRCSGGRAARRAARLRRVPERRAATRTRHDSHRDRVGRRRMRRRRLLAYEVSGDGFLRHMVRAIVGTLVEVGRGWREPESIVALLARAPRATPGPTAPPHGLFLVRWTMIDRVACARMRRVA